jgi:RNA polymerase primary sigma factor
VLDAPGEAFDLDAEALAADLPLEDPVRAYLNEIGQYALLDYEQEQGLARRIALGVAAAEQLRDEPEAPLNVCQALRDQIADGKAARHALIQANLRLVVSVAKKYAALGGMPLMDLIQEGNIGLMRAADKFDPARGLKFSTYATHWIRQGVNRGRQDQSRTVRLPVHAQEFLYKVHQVQLRLQQRLQREPRPEDLAEALGERPEKVRQALLAAQGIVLFSTPTGHDADSEFGDLLPDQHSVAPDDAATQQCLREDLRAAVARLPERERRIIQLRYGLHDGRERTLEEVGAVIGVTRERIRQLEAVALRKLRHPALGRKLRGYAQ